MTHGESREANAVFAGARSHTGAMLFGSAPGRVSITRESVLPDSGSRTPGE